MSLNCRRESVEADMAADDDLWKIDWSEWRKNRRSAKPAPKLKAKTKAPPRETGFLIQYRGGSRAGTERRADGRRVTDADRDHDDARAALAKARRAARYERDW